VDAQQEQFEAFSAPSGGTVYVSDRVCFRTEGTQRVIGVHGVVFAHYEVGDRAAETYAMITLCESGYASQTQIARSFGYSARSVRRYQEHFEAGGIAALTQTGGRPTGTRSGDRRSRGRDQTIVHLKEKGWSNRAIAGRFGVFENAIRKRLRRLGWKPAAPPGLPFDLPAITEVAEAVGKPEVTQEIFPRAPLDTPKPRSSQEADEAVDLPPPSLDVDPLDRSVDRLSAALGLIEDAAPLFAAVENLPMAGVLLAIPSLVASEVLPIARKTYRSIGPAFYGLRTTMVAYILLALLRIPRPEALKEYAPGNLGRIVGLDRMLEVKTLRRKLTDLASRRVSQDFGRELARRRVAEHGRVMGFLYIDGHVRAYHGKRTIAKGYLTRTRLAVPATTDYWVNDRKADPLFVVTADANAAMTRMLEPILTEARKLLGTRRRATIVFDRGGWSPKLFVKLLAMNFDILTYRKGRVRRIAPERFVPRTARLDGRAVKYMLFDQPVRFLKGKLRLRQVTRLSPGGYQTPVLTSRWKLRDIVVAYRMFERWRQENFFKYMRQEYLIDALVDYQVEPDDPQRSVPNPARKAVDKELRKARAEVDKIKETYGTTVLERLQGGASTIRMLNAEEKKIRHELKKANDRVQQLRVRQKSLPTRIPLAQALPNRELVKLSTERRHLTNVLKLVAYQIESDLVNLIRPHYARTDDEGRTLIQTTLQSAATLEQTDTELRVTLAPLSSAHRSQVVAALCDTLNESKTCFPGTRLRMRFAVAATPK
jgi:transposase